MEPQFKERGLKPSTTACRKVAAALSLTSLDSALQQRFHSLKIERLRKIRQPFLFEKLNRRGIARISSQKDDPAAIFRAQSAQLPVKIDPAAARHLHVRDNEVILVLASEK